MECELHHMMPMTIGRNEALLVITLFLCVGCMAETQALFPQEEKVPNVTSSRLLAQFTVPKDSEAERFYSFYDRETDGSCHLAFDEGEIGMADLLEQGTTIRCVPKFGGMAIFVDSNCSDLRVIPWPASSPFVKLDSSHGQKESYAETGVRVDIPKTYYQRFSNGSCVPREWNLRRESTLHEIDRILSKEDFPTGSLDKLLVHEQLEMGLYRDKEGNEATVYYRDLLGNITCNPDQTEAGGRCVPELGIPVQNVDYRDQECKRLIINSYTGTKVGTISNLPQFDQEIFRFSVVDVNTPISRLLPNGDCEPIDYWPTHDRSSQMYYADLYPASEWPVVNVVEKDSDRLLSKEVEFTAFELPSIDLSLSKESYYDPRFESPCSPMVVDGKIRCAPQARALLDPDSYADSACTQRLLGMIEGDKVLTAYSAVIRESAVYPGLSEALVYRVDPTPFVRHRYRLIGGVCLDAVSNVFRYHRLSPVASEELIELEITTK